MFTPHSFLNTVVVLRIHYALIQGDEEAGVTIMEMVKEMDAGDMISRCSIPITDEDNVGTLFEKLALVGRDLLWILCLPILLVILNLKRRIQVRLLSRQISSQKKKNWTGIKPIVNSLTNPWNESVACCPYFP